MSENEGADLPGVIRHSPRERDFEFATGEPESIAAISEHIELHVGKIEMVFHEVVSDLVHIDVHWVAATAERPFHTLVTSGMSDRPMNAPEGAEEFRYCELVVNLPSSWPMNHDDWKKDEGAYWPVRLMKSIARLPHEYQSWIWVGHSVGGGDEPEPYDPSTKQCAALLVPCISHPDEFTRLEVSPEKSIYFFTVLPIYSEELLYRMNRGTDALFERLERADVGDIIDPRRVNVCAARRWRLPWSK